MNTNRVTLVGYVGKDILAVTQKDGSKKVALRVATSELRMKQTEEKTYVTVWHDVVAWDSTAEFAERNFVKGSRIMVDGAISYRSYADQKGHTRYVTEIRAHSLMNLDR